jgi:hypothetical protein
MQRSWRCSSLLMLAALPCRVRPLADEQAMTMAFANTAGACVVQIMISQSVLPQLVATVGCHLWRSATFQQQIQLPTKLYPVLVLVTNMTLSHWCCHSLGSSAQRPEVLLWSSNTLLRLQVGPAVHSFAPLSVLGIACQRKQRLLFAACTTLRLNYA